MPASIQPHGAPPSGLRIDCCLSRKRAPTPRVSRGLNRDLARIRCPNSAAIFGRACVPLTRRLDAIPGRGALPPRQVARTHHRSAHHAPGGGLVVELETRGRVDRLRRISTALQTALSASSLQSLCDERSAVQVADRLRPRDDLSLRRRGPRRGLFAETRKPDLEAFLGNRYPASDIPQIARRLYERNRVRLLADLNYDPTPLAPRLSPLTGADLDMSMCFLRSVSPIHVQYLRNMGVAATLVVSLMVGDAFGG